MKRSVEERRKENLRPSVRSSVGARISHLHRNKLSGTMGSFVHSEHCKHGATVFPRTNGKALQYALLTLSTRGPAIIERPRLSFVYHTIISYLVTLHGGCRHRLASLKDTHKPLYIRVLHGSISLIFLPPFFLCVFFFPFFSFFFLVSFYLFGRANYSVNRAGKIVLSSIRPRAARAYKYEKLLESSYQRDIE